MRARRARPKSQISITVADAAVAKRLAGTCVFVCVCVLAHNRRGRKPSAGYGFACIATATAVVRIRQCTGCGEWTPRKLHSMQKMHIVACIFMNGMRLLTLHSLYASTFRDDGSIVHADTRIRHRKTATHHWSRADGSVRRMWCPQVKRTTRKVWVGVGRCCNCEKM